MPFRKQGSPFWHYDFQVNGSRYSGSTRTTDYEEAKAIEAAARVKAKAGKRKQTTFTIGQALGTYYTEVSQHQSSAATTASQARMLLRHLNPDTRLPDLTQADLARLVAHQRATVDNATSNRRVQLLGRAIRHMVKHYDAECPTLDFTAVEAKEPHERIRELTMAEQARLFQHLRPDMLPFVKFLLMTGCRRETAEVLRWKDVDFDAMTIAFQVKGDRPQPFPMSMQLRAFLSALPRSTVIEEARYVFTLVHQKTQARQRVNRNTFDSAWRKALKAAEIEDFRVHDLRHTFATRLLRETGNLKLVSRLLGHRGLETTMKYAHVLDGDLRDALAGFDVLGERRDVAAAKEQ